MSFCTSLSIGVHTAPLGRDDPLLHQNYHYRPLSWPRLLTLDSCQNLSGPLPPHPVRWQDSRHEQAANTPVPERNRLVRNKNTHQHVSASRCKNSTDRRVWRVTYVQFVGVDPVVFRELDVKLDVEVSLLKGVSVLWHSLSLHHSDTTCHMYTSLRVWRQTQAIQILKHNTNHGRYDKWPRLLNALTSQHSHFPFLSASVAFS